GALICNDVRFPQESRSLAKQGAKVIVYASAFGKKRIHHWKTLLPARAIENQCFVVGCNRAGEDDMIFGGESAVFDPQGRKVAGIRGSKPGLIVAELDFSQVDEARKIKVW
ncbi:MAG: nitrilase-related carbon-nitrogen hydrolase, partial [Candidatus Micrarchaeota archaeon]|nr:nitrilase-related carbon-nitrogen hydrolase [Candidatus Micrarchaeota archaeon]